MHKSCKNCKYVVSRCAWDFTFYECAITGASIDFPRLAGGSKRCECYTKENKNKIKNKFVYPTISDLLKFQNKKEE